MPTAPAARAPALTLLVGALTLGCGEDPPPPTPGATPADAPAPVAAAPDPVAAAQAPVVAAPTLPRLAVQHASASSYLLSRGNQDLQNYHPAFVLDDDPATAWVEGADGDGTGEDLLLTIPAVADATQLHVRLRSGYQKSARLLADNGAPSRIRVDVLQRSEVVATTEAELPRADGWQSVPVPLPGPSAFTAVRLTVLSAHAGDRHADTAISDLALHGDGSQRPMAAYLPSAEAWLAARASAAAGGADPTQGLWFTDFATTEREPTEAELAAALSGGTEARRFEGAGWHRVTLPLPPRLETPAFLLPMRGSAIAPEPRGSVFGPLLLADTATATPTTDPIAEATDDLPTNDEGWYDRTKRSHLQIARRADGGAARIRERTVSESCRSACSISTHDRVVVFHPDGRPALLHSLHESVVEGRAALVAGPDGWPVLTGAGPGGGPPALERRRIETLTRLDVAHGRIRGAESWTRDEEAQGQPDGTETVEVRRSHTVYRGRR